LEIMNKMSRKVSIEVKDLPNWKLKTVFGLVYDHLAAEIKSAELICKEKDYGLGIPSDELPRHVFRGEFKFCIDHVVTLHDDHTLTTRGDFSVKRLSEVPKWACWQGFYTRLAVWSKDVDYNDASLINSADEARNYLFHTQHANARELCVDTLVRPHKPKVGVPNMVVFPSDGIHYEDFILVQYSYRGWKAKFYRDFNHVIAHNYLDKEQSDMYISIFKWKYVFREISRIFGIDEFKFKKRKIFLD